MTAQPVRSELVERCPNEGCGYAFVRGVCPVCSYPALIHNPKRVPDVLPIGRLDQLGDRKDG